MKVKMNNGITIIDAHKDISKWKFDIDPEDGATKFYTITFIQYAIDRLYDILLESNNFSKRALRKHIRRLLSEKNGTAFNVYEEHPGCINPPRMELWINISAKDIETFRLENNTDFIAFIADYDSNIGRMRGIDGTSFYVNYNTFIELHPHNKQRLLCYSYRALWSQSLLEFYSFNRVDRKVGHNND